jgi:outer membrane receptor protein involved in Fe transport
MNASQNRATLFATALLASTSIGATACAQRVSTSTTSAVSEVVVTASRVDLVGKAVTASQGVVTKEAIELRPLYRPGQILETIPGLVATVHSGEGKANQYELRGFDVDHGTDFAFFVDDMPVNRGTNAHGQGYADQNFLIPGTVDTIDYTKGPYYAETGDFGAVGSAHVHLVDDLPNQISASVGTLNDDDLLAGGTYQVNADDRVWAAVELAHVDGPWDPPSDFNKIDAAVRFSHGTDADGYSLTAMYYASAGRLETDQSVYAIQDGLIGRYGVLDSTDHSKSYRASLSAHYGAEGPHWAFSSNAWWIDSTMSLFNNFTHFLLDPVNGDQEAQDESRDVYGGDAKLTLSWPVFGLPTETELGLEQRYDNVFVDRRHTLGGDMVLDYCEVPAVPGGIPSLPPPPPNTPPGALDDGGFGQAYAAVGGYCYADRALIEDLGAWAQSTVHFTPWLRAVLGFREEYFWAADHSSTTGFSGSKDQTLPQPKASLAIGPWKKTELYVSWGRGFHSNDVRGVFGTVGLEGLTSAAGPTPLLAPATGEEVGLRSDIVPKTSVQLAIFREDFTSELAFDEDQGEDQPTAPSRREGVEVSAQYRPLPWLELNTDLAWARARYQGSLAELEAVYQLPGDHIINAPDFIGSAGVLIDHLGHWFGSIQWRALGAYPVIDGEQYPQDPGYSEVNLDAGYRMSPRLKVTLSVFNLTDEKANAAAFDYTSRLTPTADPVTGLQIHPLEPLSARLGATATF